ncbi:RNA polymerase sigma-70 factor [uncultured Bacteroides sp.]|jgi:RNA polymerase sigma factor, sigma-70 family/RNA polymerase sigma-70 factor, Bacteroides expansion family 1|uniref:RNA polymerase sigma-70 factor n=1 Tax=uncultured Bacteroides sp. TaxID=162156 RepID=UPI002675E737|nr:RNA polymerase sigma-70 factor [uncultured Bacteroides sp.]
MTEEQAITLLSREDSHEAYSFLYKMYWSKVYNFSRLYIASVEEAKEVVQIVFVKLWETRAFLKENDNLKGYLFIVTRNVIFNQKRKSFYEDFYKTTILEAYSEDNILASCEAEEKMYALELSKFIDMLIQNLPDRQRDCFLLSRIEKLTYREIGERLGISERTVEVHIVRALKYLKQNIVLFLIFLAR